MKTMFIYLPKWCVFKISFGHFIFRKNTRKI